MTNDKKSELITRAGRAAYGSHWISEMADYVNTREHVVQQWADGSCDIPNSLVRGMLSHLYQRMDLMERVARDMIDEMNLPRNRKQFQRIIFTQWDRAPWFRPENGPAEGTEVRWFNVDGREIGLTPDNRTFNHRGEYCECDVSVEEFEAEYQRYMSDPANTYD